MKKIIFTIILILLGLTLPVDAEVQPGQQFRVPQWQWVNMIENYSVSDATCGIEFGNVVQALAVEGDTALVGYRSKGDRSGGTSCPSGIIFIIKTHLLETFTTRYTAVLLEKNRQNALIRLLLSKARQVKQQRR